VTTAQVLQGMYSISTYRRSVVLIRYTYFFTGGQTFLIKLRVIAEGSASSKLLDSEPPGMLHYWNATLA
jgi:hypothetical protein